MNIPKVPDGMLRAVWNYDLNIWEETATQEEIELHEFNIARDFYNSELEFASKATAELACEIITPEMYDDVRSYMRAIDPYAQKKTRTMSTIQRPTVFDKYK